MKLRWTLPTLTHLEQLVDYIALDNPVAARYVLSRLHEAADQLKDHPKLGRLGRLPQTRELALAKFPYLLVYRINDEHVEMVAVLHTAQQWPDSANYQNE